MFGLTPYENRNGQVAVRWPRNIFDSFFFDRFAPEFNGRFFSSYPVFRADIKDTGKEYVIEAELPGVSKENIKLGVNEDVLTITVEKQSFKNEKSEDGGDYVRRERQCGSYSRSFRIEDVNHDAITAGFENGVLKVALPKNETELSRKREIVIE